jgi:RHS repeat-associated protein
VTKGANTFFYHQDGLGSVTDLTDSTGVTAKSYAYDAYGNILESPGTLEQPYSYTGREFDSESGLLHYRARYYDQTTGRFLQKDPIGFKGGDVNLYLYTHANPVNFVDPSGNFVFVPVIPAIPPLVGAAADAAVIVGGIIGGAAIGDFILDNIFQQSRAKRDPIQGVQPVKVGRDCDGNCNPCPPAPAPWEQPGNAHGSTSGSHWHWIEWHQDKNDPDCTCYPVRRSGATPPRQ